MKILHLMAGLNETSGVANIARRFARVQTERKDAVRLLAPTFKWNPIYFSVAFAVKALAHAIRTNEIWVHCSWTFPVWYGALLAKLLRKRLIVVPEGSFDPKRLDNHAGWKKRLVKPLDKWALRMADKIVALCPDEINWIQNFEPHVKASFERVPVFHEQDLMRSHENNWKRNKNRPLHVLFLGRAEDPLKGVKYLKRAVQMLNDAHAQTDDDTRHAKAVSLRIVSNHHGDELEQDWAWCDVMCLPTLSENFGLVVAEALEHGRPVITTDGASAWEDCAQTNNALIYLRGYRNGSDEIRVTLLKEALQHFLQDN